MIQPSLLAAVVLSSASLAFGQVPQFVDASATGLNDGSSWADAHVDLQGALASGAMELWIAEGTYRPGPNGAVLSTFAVPSGVAIYGGFAGTETVLSERQLGLHETILSGDLDSDGMLTLAADAFHVLTMSGADSSTLLDGLTITRGTGDGDQGGGVGGLGGAGGGAFLENSSPLFRDCRFVSNRARLGSGVYAADSSPSFEHCEFLSNNSARSGDGGAIYTIVSPGQTESLTIQDCFFRFNSVRQGHWATGHGGAIYNSEGSTLTLERTRFVSNATWHNSTFGNATTGGAISNFADGLYAEACKFEGGYSNIGAGVYTTGTAVFVNCEFKAGRAVYVSTCGGFDCPSHVPDITSAQGGAIFGSGTVVTLLDSTVAGNFASKRGGGVFLSFNAVLECWNSIIYGNEIVQLCCGEDPLPPLASQISGGTEDIVHSCVEFLLTPEPGEDPIDPSNYPGSFELDPLFVVQPVLSGLGIPSYSDYRLRPNSPCIDAGDSALIPTGVTSDLAGNARISAVSVDMGAYEFRPEASFLNSCFGDGGDQLGCTDCPCGNNSPLGTVGGCINSAGYSARLEAQGSSSLSNPTLCLEMAGGVPDTFAILISGNSIAPAGPMHPCFGLNSGMTASGQFDGLRCVVQGVLRHGTRPIDSLGAVADNGFGPEAHWGFCSPGFPNASGFVSGQTRHFQAVYRDLSSEGCETGQNTTQAVTMTFGL